MNRSLISLSRNEYLVLAVLLGGAVYIHAVAHVFMPYTWLRSAELIRNAVMDPVFPPFALFVTLAVWLSLDAGQRREWLALRRGSFVVFLLLSIAVALVGPLWGGLEFAAILPVLWAASAVATRSGVLRVIASAIAGLLILTTVSYIFTLYKSQLFFLTKPLDGILVGIEQWLFGLPLHRLVASWAEGHRWVVDYANWIYFLFFQHMALVSLGLWLKSDMDMQIRYIGSLTLCYLIGGLSYYLFPALGPVYWDPLAFAFLRETPLFTTQVQDVLASATEVARNGSVQTIQTYAYIAATPSLHMAHETVMLFFSRRVPLLFLFSLIFWCSSAGAVLVLGWHYVEDIFAGLLLAALSVTYVVRRQRVVEDARQVAPGQPRQALR